MASPIRFSRTDSKDFIRTLNKRVNTYFKDNQISKTGNWKLHVKTVVMFSLFFVPYILILFTPFSPWIKLGMSILMGVGMAGVGMNIMHDGNHGSYSKKKWVNKLMGGSIYILAGNVYNWQVQHNVLHHTYTNVHGHDEDISVGQIVRFTPEAKWRKFHKFQHIYSFFLYGLLTINWAITTDFRQSRKYLKQKLSYGKLPNPLKQWSTVAISKVVYVLLWIVTPILLTELTWWMVIIGFVAMHFTAGLILSVVFQLAHVTENTIMPIPDEELKFEHAWITHQLFTTANFSVHNKFVSWFTGGLNQQVEHHIFPNISHIHYGKIRKIVKQTAEEFNLPYFEYKSTRAAIISHYRFLKELGNQPKLA
ncbi:fatty acid desaturase family protein [Psychroflexus salis]|uniref:Fatty acid desaturase n=1 Tax=Psychroflexus salis TaxID=1526574 RepID=A0A916ZXF1_9FLAO|nr:acyl-CoA desaturase [Psychroflexus salis]GGE17837.1 fatty acid desaturase [Psychroflexus salis]